MYKDRGHSLPPHVVTTVLAPRVEQLVPGAVGEVETVAPQHEHEHDDHHVLGRKTRLEIRNIFQNWSHKIPRVVRIYVN